MFYVHTMQVSARPFEMRGNDATEYCDGLSPDAMRASLQEPPAAAEQTRMTTTVAKRIAQACPSIARDDCAAGAQGDRIARVILRLPYGVQNRSAKCLSSWRFSRANQAPARSRVGSSTYIIGLLPNCAESKQRVLFRHNYAVTDEFAGASAFSAQALFSNTSRSNRSTGSHSGATAPTRA